MIVVLDLSKWYQNKTEAKDMHFILHIWSAMLGLGFSGLIKLALDECKFGSELHLSIRCLSVAYRIIYTTYLSWPQVQASDSLLKLVSDLKQTALFSGFASLNDHVEERMAEFDKQAEKTDRMLSRIGEEAAASLKELEAHYYSSSVPHTHENDLQQWP